MRVSVGEAALFHAEFRTSSGAPAVLSEQPEVKFFREGEQVWSSVPVVVTDLGAGRWSASIEVPEESMPGWARISWFAVAGSNNVEGHEDFEIVLTLPSGSMTSTEHGLRRRLRDVLVDPEDDSGAFFSNDEIHTLLAVNNGSVLRAAFDGWTMKAAHYQMLVDVDESGSSRKLSQVFKNAEAMLNFYAKTIKDDTATSDGARAGRVVGKVVNLRGEFVDSFGLMAVAKAGAFGNLVYYRPFPTKRLITGII